MDSLSNNEDTNTSAPLSPNEMYLSFPMISNSITYVMLSDKADDFVIHELRAFIQVRSKVVIRGSKLSYLNVPSRKDKLMLRLVELRNHPPN